MYLFNFKFLMYYMYFLNYLSISLSIQWTRSFETESSKSNCNKIVGRSNSLKGVGTGNKREKRSQSSVHIEELVWTDGGRVVNINF